MAGHAHSKTGHHVNKRKENLKKPCIREPKKKQGGREGTGHIKKSRESQPPKTFKDF